MRVYQFRHIRILTTRPGAPWLSRDFHTRRIDVPILVRLRGLEPPPPFEDNDLNVARLPIPPQPRAWNEPSARHHGAGFITFYSERAMEIYAFMHLFVFAGKSGSVRGSRGPYSDTSGAIRRRRKRRDSNNTRGAGSQKTSAVCALCDL